MIATLRATALGAVLLSAVAACTGASTAFTAAEFAGYPEKYQWTEEKALRHGWIAGSVQRAEPVYCYATPTRSKATAICASRGPATRSCRPIS